MTVHVSHRKPALRKHDFCKLGGELGPSVFFELEADISI